MVCVFLADGFEEVEAITPVDVLRRAGCEVRTVGVSSRMARGAHGVCVECDLTGGELPEEGLEMIVLPGGMPGTRNLGQSALVREALGRAARGGLYIGAICAAPSVLGSLGLLDGRRFTCFPGYEDAAPGGRYSAGGVVRDGTIITAAGAGVALPFGLALAEALKGREAAEAVAAAMQCR